MSKWRNDARPAVGSNVLGRRQILQSAAVLVVPTSVLFGCSSKDGAAASPPGPGTIDLSLFAHGVASGDPLPDAVMLWTRVTTPNAARVDVNWEVAEDVAMTKVIASGTFATDADRDYTVKVDARGLAAGRTYYYRFRVADGLSPIGRTRTAPSGSPERLRFAVMSCSSFAHGYFHAYRSVSERLDLDAVIHLGDYIYEYGGKDYGDARAYEPAREILSLEDYRVRHAQYKRDADLQAVHRQHVFITIWDDHEIANDSYRDGAENHDSATEGSWADRKAAALRAYREWMPIRESADGRIFRMLAFGDLVDLVLLDTRHWARTEQAGGVLGEAPAPDPSRTLLGDDQAAWLEDSLRTSSARWKVIAQQVMVGNLNLGSGQIANLDQWHGYPESRNRLLTFFRDSGVKNVVVLTGDIHSSWANELVFDPTDTAAYDPATGRGSLAVEIVTPAITSPGIPQQFLSFLESARPSNPHVRWNDPTLRGYVVLDVSAERVQGAWYLFEDITQPERATATFRSAWSVRAGETRLNEDKTPAPDGANAPAAAPEPQP